MTVSEKAEKGCLSGVAEFSSSEEVRLPQLMPQDTVISEAVCLPKRHMCLHTHAIHTPVCVASRLDQHRLKCSASMQVQQVLFCFPPCWSG